jgi:hypothetical protein
MIFYLCRNWNKKAGFIMTLLALIVAARQISITAQCQYAEELRYIADARLAGELDQMIRRVQPDNAKLPVAVYGHYNTVSETTPGFIKGDEIGAVSAFETAAGVYLRNYRLSENRGALFFMRSQGLYYDIPSERQWEEAVAAAESMPAYPFPGCVERLSDVIVVKLSDDQ